MNQCAGRSERRRFERNRHARATPDRAVITGLDAFGLVACQQQNFVEDVVSRYFIDQRVEERTAADMQHGFRRRPGALAKPRAEPADEDDRLSQHSAPSQKPHSIMCPAARWVS